MPNSRQTSPIMKELKAMILNKREHISPGENEETDVTPARYIIPYIISPASTVNARRKIPIISNTIPSIMMPGRISIE